jgi:tRNA pseudouridine13 synthase
MSSKPVIKHRPADFLVREMVVLSFEPAVKASQHYLLLRKCGYTTMQAITLLAEFLGVDRRVITYGGLKDEDGITEQVIAVPQGSAPSEVFSDGWRCAEESASWLLVQHYGYGTDAMRIGQLEGNGFRVVVRNLSEPVAHSLADPSKVTVFSPNYYDAQRFGVPGGPKRTHLVGASILERRWDTALAELVALRSPESVEARQWTGKPQSFFDELDPRTVSFYLAAHASMQWNQALSNLVRETCPHEHFTVDVEGISYLHVTSVNAAARILGKALTLPYIHYNFHAGHVQARESVRTTVVQSIVSVAAAEPDQAHSGRYCCNLRFFLPSGCYATVVVRQLLSFLRGAECRIQ